MAISTTSLKELIDAFAVMSVKDSITPTTVATVFYRLANLLSDCASESDISTVKNMINGMGNAIAEEKTRASNAEASLQRLIDNLSTTLASNLAKEIARAKAAEADLTTLLANEVVRAKQAEFTNKNNIELLRKTHANDIKALNDADDVIRKAISDLTTKLTNEVSRATKAESTLSAFNSRLAKALEEEINRSINKDDALERAIDLLKRNLASEQTRAKNAETAIIAYMISIINSQTPNGVNAGTTITVNIEDEPGAIWAILTHAPEKSVYQGVLGELTFTMMHAATENTHILMWPSGDGVNVFTISNIEDEIKTSQSRLSLYD